MFGSQSSTGVDSSRQMGQQNEVLFGKINHGLLLSTFIKQQARFQLEVPCTEDNCKRQQLTYSYMQWESYWKHRGQSWLDSTVLLCKETVVCVVYALFNRQTAGSRLDRCSLFASTLIWEILTFPHSICSEAAQYLPQTRCNRLNFEWLYFYPRSDFQKHIRTRTAHFVTVSSRSCLFSRRRNAFKFRWKMKEEKEEEEGEKTEQSMCSSNSGVSACSH